jgi:hypothetical protein
LYYLCLAQTTGTSSWSPFGTLSSYYTPQNLIFYSGLSAGFMSQLTVSYGYFGIEGIFVPDIVHPVSTPSAVCIGSSAVLTVQGIADSFTWSPGGANSASISVTPTANTVYSVTGSYSGQCTSTGSVNVLVVQLPNVTAAASPTAVCLGGTVALTAGGASTYTWDTNATTQTIIESPAASTIYTVTGTSALGCVNSNTVNVTVNSFTPSITSPTTVCTGSQVTLVAGGGVSYLWVNNSAPFSSITVSVTANTTFTVNATDANGCKGSATVPVFVNPNPTVTASASRSVMCRKETNTITAQGASTYTWSAGGSGAVISFTPTLALPVTFTVTGFDNNGCKSTTTVNVQVSTCNGIDEARTVPVSVFPNPGSGIYTLVNEGALFERIDIYNHAGQLIKTQTSGTGIDEIDISGEANGIYEVYFFGNLHSARLRIVKQ